MAVTAVTNDTQSTPTQNTTTSSSAQGSEYLDYDAFLMLFMESLKNQDPTEPMDTAEYMGQLAQFSNVEQTMKMNTNLTTMLQQDSIHQASNIVGATITLQDGTSGVVESVQIYTDGNVAVLEDGTPILLEPGISISYPEAAASDDSSADSSDEDASA
ncbi:flagellar hook assembly protein FlgD [Flexibacterium corallicola]|uniref:flagellar hook assembly protein FlgD n=1 Tax=Flexibacterium corallicola TaxID=3037259 RepID=UPI00286F2481|nr:flagellar hook assembly protein FlgD [Pseudovibrio sp. M1P-2-3]